MWGGWAALHRQPHRTWRQDWAWTELRYTMWTVGTGQSVRYTPQLTDGLDCLGSYTGKRLSSLSPYRSQTPEKTVISELFILHNYWVPVWLIRQFYIQNDLTPRNTYDESGACENAARLCEMWNFPSRVAAPCTAAQHTNQPSIKIILWQSSLISLVQFHSPSGIRVSFSLLFVQKNVHLVFVKTSLELTTRIGPLMN